MHESELVIGLIAPIGVDLDSVQIMLTEALHQFKYTVNVIRLSDKIKAINGLKNTVKNTNEFDRVNSYMTAGNEIRERLGRGDAIVGLAIADIYNKRRIGETTKEAEPLNKTAHILRSLKHPEEIRSLRALYDDGFFLIGITSSREKRYSYLIDRKKMTKDQADTLMDRDQQEEVDYGQHTGDAFHLADGFVDIGASTARQQVNRIVDLLFCSPYLTPNKDEYSMFLAVAASLRSADLSRQVGAVVMSETGDVIATGSNDVPSCGGGLYWNGSENDARDFKLGFDSNDKRKQEMADEILEAVEKEIPDEKTKKNIFKGTGLFDITEYGRAVHAEMEALLSCARSGVSTKNATLYCTTFPCHNCAKHIVAAGIARVVFIEPYPKSQALVLHKDSISFEHESIRPAKKNQKTVEFESFVGIGPKKFIDLFSMKLGSGSSLKREEGGRIVAWEKEKAVLRVPILPMSYIDKEMKLQRDVAQLIAEKEMSHAVN